MSERNPNSLGGSDDLEIALRFLTDNLNEMTDAQVADMYLTLQGEAYRRKMTDTHMRNLTQQ